MVIMGPSTEKKPFAAQAQGMRSLRFSPRHLMPAGNGIPRKNPSGISTITTVTTLEIKGSESIRSDRKGTRIMANNIIVMGMDTMKIGFLVNLFLKLK